MKRTARYAKHTVRTKNITDMAKLLKKEPTNIQEPDEYQVPNEREKKICF